MVELIAAGCCEFQKLNMFREIVEHTCERKICQYSEMHILPWRVSQLQLWREGRNYMALCTSLFLLAHG